MAGPPACHRPCQNLPPTGKDEPTDPIPTEMSNTYTPTPAVSRTPTLAARPAPALAPTAVDSTVRYSEADL